MERDLTAAILASASHGDRVEHVYCEAGEGGHYVVIFLHESIDEIAADRCDQLVRRAFAPLVRDDSWKLVDQALKPFGR
ncbi:hypothetical protein [Glycomyces xiaoerkulensis]|uniref:hypothetical protein n=1 Tax=Glycomyces xiaoerkulensis TaxID=2038139 RepID=UPI000C25D474|nr:hypothetical protein [Glycomyces xiaoerkulensis]